MAQFRGTVQGNRSEASRLGTKKSGVFASVNGWRIGFDSQANHDANTKKDWVSATLSGGSDGSGIVRRPDIHIVADESGSYRIRLDNKVIAEKGDL